MFLLSDTCLTCEGENSRCLDTKIEVGTEAEEICLTLVEMYSLVHFYHINWI